jgi:hypothetical protein
VRRGSIADPANSSAALSALPLSTIWASCWSKASIVSLPLERGLHAGDCGGDREQRVDGAGAALVDVLERLRQLLERVTSCAVRDALDVAAEVVRR